MSIFTGCMHLVKLDFYMGKKGSQFIHSKDQKKKKKEKVFSIQQKKGGQKNSSII